MSDGESVTRRGGARGRLALLLAGIVLAVVAVLAASLEWGRLIVNGRLVVIDDGLSMWQGIVVLAAAAVGVLVMALSVAASRGRPAAIAALVSGAVIVAVAIDALVWLVTRPDDLAAQVRDAAAAIPLKGYVVPPIESLLGPGAWLALGAGLLLVVLGIVGTVVPAWRARLGPRS